MSKHTPEGTRVPRQRSPTGWVADGDSLRDLVVRIGSLVAVFYLFDEVFVRFGTLPEEGYSGVSVVQTVVSRLASASLVSVAVGIVFFVAAVAAFRNRSIGPRWSDIEFGARIRVFVVFVAAILAWFYSTYDANLFFGQLHTVDRLLLVACVPLIYWRPIFSLPMLIVLVPIVRQFNVPFGGFSWSEPVLLIRILVLALALVTIRQASASLRIFSERLPTPTGASFVFVLCCLIASHYWVSGYGKLELGWFTVDRIHYLLPATYSTGWLGFLDPNTIASLAQRLAAFDVPMKVWTLIVECGAAVAMIRRGSVRFFLVAWITLHTGIYLTTGICFWRWILLDAAVLLIFWGRGSPRLDIFTPAHRFLSLVLIIGGSIWFGPVKLAWYDVPANYSYRVIADGSDGKAYRLPPRFFAPYDYQFTLTGFGFVVEEPVLEITWGSTQRREVSTELGHAASVAEALAVESQFARILYNPRRRANFERFLHGFGTNWNASRAVRPDYGLRQEWWRWLQAPSQLWTFPRATSIPRDVTIERLRLHQVFAFFDGSTYHEIRDRQVLSVNLED